MKHRATARTSQAAERSADPGVLAALQLPHRPPESTTRPPEPPTSMPARPTCQIGRRPDLAPQHLHHDKNAGQPARQVSTPPPHATRKQEGGPPPHPQLGQQGGLAAAADGRSAKPPAKGAVEVDGERAWAETMGLPRGVAPDQGRGRTSPPKSLPPPGTAPRARRVPRRRRPSRGLRPATSSGGGDAGGARERGGVGGI